ncbi:GNAT family N-acetyltransferase [Massilia sp. CCM 8733]|uniref:GNAT family N-acetyltransferase n=1 Tax=Massilia mucilaginosa TaxID=2609282 RepID=A0ABX0NTE1_9BURK|nr:GNAT family N-acetyltransferase [Massilia mucilaginosa]NHZ90005.1 GNAT family N-acetyltransferase [Massilia mucilaginosa]
MLTLRAALLADIDAMWALRTRAILHSCPGHYPAEVIAPWSAAPAPRSYPGLVQSGGALIAQERGAMLGYAIVDLDAGEVDAVFVDPAAGGRGIGKTMLAALEPMALARGCTRLHLSASLNAVAFYQAAGFVALRNAVYAHPSGVALDCVEMEKAMACANQLRASGT